jgi:hypothetical protein
MIDPKRDLTEVGIGLFDARDWIVPLRPNQPIGRYPSDGDDRRRKIQRAVDEYNRAHRQARDLEFTDG